MLKTAKARLTPEEKLAHEKQEQIGKEKKIKLIQDFNRTFSSDHGMRVLRWFMEQCGYQSASVTANRQTGEILIDNTIYNEARRNLYLQVREKLQPQLLSTVENLGFAEDESVDIFS